MTTHETLVKQAKDAVDSLFSDTSVPQSQTRQSMRDLILEMEEMLSTLDEEAE